MGDSNGNSDKPPYWEIKLPGGITMKFGGREIFLVILVGLFGFFVWDRIETHDSSNGARLLAIEKAMTNQMEAQEATTYILTLTQEERQKLNLSKPKRIREMERDR